MITIKTGTKGLIDYEVIQPYSDGSFDCGNPKVKEKGKRLFLNKEK